MPKPTTPLDPGDVQEALNWFNGFAAAHSIYHRYCMIAREHGREEAVISKMIKLLEDKGLSTRVRKGKLQFFA